MEVGELRALITGGAGFVGSHLADALLASGHEVRVLDNLDPQVHLGRETAPPYLNPQAEFVYGDVRDADLLARALQDIDVVYHQAAAVGVSQSMYRVRHYVEANCTGTASLLEVILSRRTQVGLLVVASSMSVYGEGEYECSKCGVSYPEMRPAAQAGRQEWEHRCEGCQGELRPRPTRESKPLRPRSPYAISKRDQEELCLVVAQAHRLPAIALRYFNVYGSRQALSNPYTGLAVIFSSRLLSGRPPVVFEDGLQTRDFVHVSDVVRANVLALEATDAIYQPINIGSGTPTTVLDVAQALARLLGSNVQPLVPGKYRAGDVRHCFADVARARSLVGFSAAVRFEDGLSELVSWLADQRPQDRLDQALGELAERGLTC
jgi:dTDP-L-rhamnose 4-epimerase